MIGEPWMPYRDAMMGINPGIQANLNIQRSASPGPLMPNADLIGNYRSGMMDYRESGGHKDWLKQQDAAFNAPTGLNSHREMNFGESVVTPKVINIFVKSDYQQRVDVGNEAFLTRRREEMARKAELMREVQEERHRKYEEHRQAIIDFQLKEQKRILGTFEGISNNPLYVNIKKNGEYLGNGFGIQPMNMGNDVLPSGGMHDSFKVNSSGDIFGGHTTIELKGGLKKRLGW